jgi:hypothetical protein
MAGPLLPLLPLLRCLSMLLLLVLPATLQVAPVHPCKTRGFLAGSLLVLLLPLLLLLQGLQKVPLLLPLLLLEGVQRVMLLLLLLLLQELLPSPPLQVSSASCLWLRGQLESSRLLVLPRTPPASAARKRCNS